ncbi:uncharacterized protein LOC106170276 [Lingula anatina]|uniref:Uncharacterized protein LOC106170276 n=1 Tax=Lingula anatina TaxID=7574 RepID=A0A1S3J563_LINAN|nr:uncharacterized protein LOC106170276 [Lingula anatina]XP_013405525.1 uncharacterized protein LOC106170276 [Lingula anatina]|eukprot:XP_013405524.1 uncharacterized protein LOC106170276 [Lingula anatina]
MNSSDIAECYLWQNNATFDATEELQYQISTWLNKTVPPILLIIGTLGNILSYLVLRRPFMRRTWIGFFLRALAVTDTFALWLGLSRHMIRVYGYFDIREAHAAVCKLHRFTLYFFLDMSTWLLVGLTVGRYISTCHILQSYRLCSTKRARIALAVIVGCVFAKNAHVLVTVDINVDALTGERHCNHYCDSDHHNFWKYIYPWITFCVYAAGPFAVMIVLNILIVRSLRRSTRFQLRSTRNSAYYQNNNDPPSTSPLSVNSFNNNNHPLEVTDDTTSGSQPARIAESPRKGHFRRHSRPTQMDNIADDHNSATHKSPAQEQNRETERLSRQGSNIVRQRRGVNSNQHAFASRSITVMLFVVTIIFLILATPSFINLIIEPYQHINSSRQKATQRLTSTIVLMLNYSNHTINFLLYCVSGRRFRNEFLRMLRRNAGRRFESNFGSSRGSISQSQVIPDPAATRNENGRERNQENAVTAETRF